LPLLYHPQEDFRGQEGINRYPKALSMYQDVEGIPILDYSVNSYDSKDKRKEETTGKTPEPEPAPPCMGYREDKKKCNDPSQETQLEKKHTQSLK